MRFVYRILGRLGLLPRNPDPRGVAMLGDMIVDMESEIVAELALADADRKARSSQALGSQSSSHRRI